MKRILRVDGWDEVTTKKVRVKFKAKPFQPASHWVNFIDRHPNMDNAGRNHCDRCGLRWRDADPKTMTYFVMTDKGNKVVCHTCWNQLHGKGFCESDRTNIFVKDPPPPIQNRGGTVNKDSNVR